MAEMTRLTMERLQEMYPPERYIHVVPSVSKYLLGPSMYGIDVATVKIDPNDQKLVYPLKTTGYGENEKVVEVGLSAISIDRIAGMADISIVPETLTDTDDLLVVRATAIMQTPGGAVRGRASQVRWDRRLMRDKLMFNAENFVEFAISKGWREFKNLSQEQRAAAIHKKFTKEFLAECEFGPRKAESKAARNAAKHLLAIADAYPPEVLAAKEFCIVKFVFSPDLSDPMVKRMVVEAGLRAQRALFGVSVAAASGAMYLPAETMEAPAAHGVAAQMPEPADVEEVAMEDAEIAPPVQDAPQGDGEPAAEAEVTDPLVVALQVTRDRLRAGEAAGLPQNMLADWRGRFADAHIDADIEALRGICLEVFKQMARARAFDALDRPGPWDRATKGAAS